MTTLLLHPGYFPSIAQMAAVAQADAIVFEKFDNFQKQTYRNRSYIAHSNGLLQLNVPVKHSKKGERQLYKDIKTENDFPWLSQHWKSLQSAYRTSPYFEYYEDDLAPLFSQKVTHLYDFNLSIFETLCDLIGVDISIDFSTEYFRNPQDCIDGRPLINAKKRTQFSLKPYHQVLQAEGDFLENLSVLDLLFNEGPNSLDYLETQTINIPNK